MGLSIDNSKNYMGIKEFTIPKPAYLKTCYKNMLLKDSFELSDLSTYTNTEFKHKNILKILFILLSGIFGIAAFSKTLECKKLANEIIKKARLREFKNFDVSKLLNSPPTMEEIYQALNSKLDKIILPSFFADEQKITAQDVLPQLDKYFVDSGFHPMNNDFIASILQSGKKRHLLNNILGICAQDAQQQVNVVPGGGLFDVFEKFDDKISVEQIDTLTKIFLDSSVTVPKINYLSSYADLFDNFETQIKIRALNQYILDKTKIYLPCDSWYKDVDFEDYKKFVCSLRKGTAEKGILIDYGFNFKEAAKYLNSLNDNAVKLINSSKLNKLDTEKSKMIYSNGIDYNVFFDFEEFLNIESINELDIHKKEI